MDEKLDTQLENSNQEFQETNHSFTNGCKAKFSRVSSVKTEWVRLNIGGKEFVTTKTTLCKNAQSFFFKLCQDDPSIGLTTDKVAHHLCSFYLT